MKSIDYHYFSMYMYINVGYEKRKLQISHVVENFISERNFWTFPCRKKKLMNKTSCEGNIASYKKKISEKGVQR